MTETLSEEIENFAFDTCLNFLNGLSSRCLARYASLILPGALTYTVVFLIITQEFETFFEG